MSTASPESPDARSDLRRAFFREALERAAGVDAGGPLFALEDVAAYLTRRHACARADHPMPIATASTRRR